MNPFFNRHSAYGSDGAAVDGIVRMKRRKRLKLVATSASRRT